jgi:Xaa-Pro aminopeptidase
VSVHDQRMDRLRHALRGGGLGALLVTDAANVTYLTGFRGDDSWLLVTGARQWFLTDSRYTEQAAAEAPQCELVERKETLVKTLAEVFPTCGAQSLAFEAPSVSYASYVKLADALDGAELTPKESLVEKLREVKDEGEIARIRQAVEVAEGAFEDIRGRLAPGQTEHEVATQLDHAMRVRGAARSSFESIVAARERSSLPHARATEARLAPDDAVLVDWGAERDLYCSDATRMLFLAPPHKRWREIYAAVLAAQQAAVEAIRPGAPLREVDAAARDHIAKAGYGDRFGHGLGHGVGLRVHESPSLNKQAEGELAEGMVLTIEPGIYLPGWGGVRIEDLVCVRSEGAEVLSSLPKTLDAAILS